MTGQAIDMKYLRIAELAENIEKLNTIIELHQKTTNDASMIKQYAYKRAEQIVELQELFSTLSIMIVPNQIQLSMTDYKIQIPDREKLPNHLTKIELMFTALGAEINKISRLEGVEINAISHLEIAK